MCFQFEISDVLAALCRNVDTLAEVQVTKQSWLSRLNFHTHVLGRMSEFNYTSCMTPMFDLIQIFTTSKISKCIFQSVLPAQLRDKKNRIKVDFRYLQARMLLSVSMFVELSPPGEGGVVCASLPAARRHVSARAQKKRVIRKCVRANQRMLIVALQRRASCSTAATAPQRGHTSL